MNIKCAVLLICVITFVPVISVTAQTANEYEQEHNILDDILSGSDTSGPVGLVSELNRAHSTVTDIMIGIADTIYNGGYVVEDIYLEGVFVDEDAMELVVILDPAQSHDPVDVEDLQEGLDINVPIRIMYGFLVPEASPSEATSCPASPSSNVCYYWGRYVDVCLPERTTSRCTAYTTLITGAGYQVPTMLNTPADSDGDGINDDVDQCDDQAETVNGYSDADGCPDTVPAPTRTTVFSDDFEGDFSKWTKSGQLEWRIGYPDDRVYINGNNTNSVAEADDCDNQACVITSQSFDLHPYSEATLEFDRFVDSLLDNNEYLEVRIGNDDQYARIFYWTDGSGDDSTWHHESYDLQNYLSSGSVTIQFRTEQNARSEDVAIDNVLVSGRTDQLNEASTPITTTFYGGNAYIFNYTNNYRGMVDNKTTTITIGATNSSGHKGFVIAAHGVSTPLATDTFNGHLALQHNSALHKIISNDPAINILASGNTDAVFIGITEPNIVIPNNQIQMKNGTIIDVMGGSLVSVNPGQEINMYGRWYNSEGRLFYKNATVFGEDRRVFYNMGISSYASRNGDSGAPIIYYTEGSAHLVGVHQGVICIFRATPSSGLTNVADSAFCDPDSDPSIYYKTFTAWENVVSKFGLQ